MSSAPVSVRFDVQGSERITSETRKIRTELDALRTSTGGITSSVKQMEAGFRSDVLGGFATSVTNADTKVTGLRTKLTQFGGTLAQNATSFGVATASVWGIYNAYDGLEKVQIRAHAAQTRVATLETTVATLTARRDAAVRKGNLSAEQMAILDDRITNAHSKLAVAQERNADLQQDVNEAWAGFVSQVGPQAVAAGASIVQLVTNLRGSFSGVIPAIKGFFSSFTGGAPAIMTVNNAALASSPILRNMTTSMEGAAVATRGMSVAMKGLLISTGIGAIIAVVGILAELAINAASASEAIDTSKESLASAEAQMESVKETLAGLQQIVDANTRAFGDGFRKATEAAQRFVAASDFAKIKTEMNANEIEVDRLVAANNKLAREYADIINHQSLFAEGLGLNNARLKEIEQQMANNSKAILNLLTGTDDLTKKERQLNALLVLQNTEGLDPNVKFLLQHIAAGKTDAEAQELLRKALLAGNGSLKQNTLEIKSNTEVKEDAVTTTNNWLLKLAESIDSQKLEESQLRVIAVRLGATRDVTKMNKEELQKYIEQLLRHGPAADKVAAAEANLQEMLKKKAEAFEESFKIANDEIAAEEEKQKAFQDSIAVQKEVVAQTFGAAEAAQMAGESNADYATRLNELSDIGIQRANQEKAYMLSLIQTAVAMNLNITRQEDLANAMHDGKAAVQALILSDSTLNGVLADTNRNIELRDAGLVKGRESALAWYDQMITQIAVDQQFAEDQDIIAAKFANVLPAGIDLTREQMTALITSMNDAGKYAATLGDIMNTAFSASRAALQELIDAAVEGGKDWKDKWKDLKEIIPKELRKDSKEFIDDQAEIAKKITEVIDKIALYRGAWNDYNKDQKKIAIKDLTGDLQDLEDQLDDVTQIDVSKLVDPLIEMAKDGLTVEEFNVWQGFFELFNKLKENGIDDEDVRQLQEYVDKHKGMKDLGDATGETSDQFAGLDENQRKIAENNILARTINQVTINVNLQARAVRGLTSDFNQLVLIVQKLQNIKNQGKTGRDGYQNVSQDIPFDPTFQKTPSEEDPNKKPVTTTITKTIIYKADIKQFLTAADTVVKRVAFIDALRPIVDFRGDHRQFMKAGADVAQIVSAIDKLRPIVDFLGDHRQFMKAASDVAQVVKEIDKLRPIVDFMGDHSKSGNFMKAAADVEKKINQLDGKVVTVIIKAKRVGNFTAQTGMHATLQDDAWIYAHKNERVDIAPPGDEQLQHGPGAGTGTFSNVKSPSMIHLEIPVSIGNDVIKKYIKDIPLADTGMFASA